MHTRESLLFTGFAVAAVSWTAWPSANAESVGNLLLFSSHLLNKVVVATSSRAPIRMAWAIFTRPWRRDAHCGTRLVPLTFPFLAGVEPAKDAGGNRTHFDRVAAGCLAVWLQRQHPDQDLNPERPR
jgi:hypothetical protein